jgi:hypothetical protein
MPTKPKAEQKPPAKTEGLHEATPKPARTLPEPTERPYSEAMTDEQKAALEADGLL